MSFLLQVCGEGCVCTHWIIMWNGVLPVGPSPPTPKATVLEGGDRGTAPGQEAHTQVTAQCWLHYTRELRL